MSSSVKIICTSHQDTNVSEEVRDFLSAEGVDIVTCAEILGVEGRSGADVSVAIRGPNGEQTIRASHILVATGRTPNTSGMGLDTAGVALDPRGYIRVNDRLETTAPNIWAIGECAGSPRSLHTSLSTISV